jgi:type IV pilus assembly protein PilO
LAKKPPAVQLGILIAACGLLGVAYWQLYYSSMSEELTSAKAQHTQLEQENKRVKAQLDEWEDLVLQRDELGDKLKNNQISLPDASELPAFFAHLQKQAAASGVTITNWKRTAETPVETYFRVPVDVEITGTFYQINKYFHLLFQTERIISVENLSITSPAGRGDEIILKAKFTAATYRAAAQPKAPTTPTPAPTPPGGATPPSKTGGAGGDGATGRVGKIKDKAVGDVEAANEKTGADADKAAEIEPAKGADGSKSGAGQ